MTVTNELTQQILDYLFNHKVYAWRQNSGGIFDQSIGRYRASAKKGVSDILGVNSDGRFVAIEVKTGKDRLRPEQIGFLESVALNHGIAMVVRNYEEFLELWNSLYSV